MHVNNLPNGGLLDPPFLPYPWGIIYTITIYWIMPLIFGILAWYRLHILLHGMPPLVFFTIREWFVKWMPHRQ